MPSTATHPMPVFRLSSGASGANQSATLVTPSVPSIVRPYRPIKATIAGILFPFAFGSAAASSGRLIYDWLQEFIPLALRVVLRMTVSPNEHFFLVI